MSVWNAASGGRLAVLGGHTGPITDISFNATASRLVTASGDGTAKLWDLDANRLAEELRGHRGWVTTAAFAPDGRTILTASQDGTARIWDATAGRPSEEFKAGSTLTSASFAAGRASRCSRRPSPRVKLWDLGDGLARGRRSRAAQLVNDADISPDGT